MTAFISFITLILCFVVFPVGATAQVATFNIAPEPLYPRPSTLVTVTLNALGMNLNQAYITWRVDGVVVLEGAGATKYVLTTGRAGRPMTLSVDARTPGGLVINQTKTIIPAFASIAWEADTYVAPLFKGKPLITPSSHLRFIAITSIANSDGTEMPSDALIYTWLEGDRELQDRSGRGKSVLEYDNTTFTRPISIRLRVQSPDGKITTGAAVTIPVVEPRLLVYAVTPLLGVMYQTPIDGSTAIHTAEQTYVAEPYYVSTPTRTDGALEYLWFAGGTQIASQSQVTLRPPEGESGHTQVELRFRHLERLLQTDRVEFNLNYDAVTAPASAAPSAF